MADLTGVVKHDRQTTNTPAEKVNTEAHFIANTNGMLRWMGPIHFVNKGISLIRKIFLYIRSLEAFVPLLLILAGG